MGAGFKITGVYLLNRNVGLRTMKNSTAARLTKSSSFTYLPMYSPTPRRKQHRVSDLDTENSLPSDSSSSESSPEVTNITNVDRTSPQQESEPKGHSLVYKSQTKEFLLTPTVPPKLHPERTKSSGRVLTSFENIQLMEDKEKEKEEKKKLQQERKEK